MIRACGGRRGRRRRSRLLLVVAAFVGLFAMHGLGDHGTVHQEMSATQVVDSCAGHSDHGAMGAGSGVSGDVGSAGSVLDEASIAGLCLAVLGGVVLALAWLRSRVPLWVSRRGLYRSVSNLRATALRDRDPPCLFELSIQRC